MSEPRQVKFDVEATVLAAICLFLWISLLSYDAGDAVGPLVAPFNQFYEPSQSVYPLNQTTQNWCGWAGALAAQMMVDGLGIGAIPLVAAMTALTIWMFRVQSNFVAPSRQFGWLLVIVAFTTFATLLKLETPQAPVIGAGGYLGALTTTWLDKHFATVGSFILTSAVMVAGLLLSTDYVVLRWLGWLVHEGSVIAGQTAVVGSRGLSSLNPLAAYAARIRRSDVDQGVVLPGEGGDSMSIRIRGQQFDGKTLQATTAPAAAPPAAATATAATSPAAKSNGKAAESIIAGVAAVASNLLAGKAKAESDEVEETEDDEAAEDEELVDEAEAEVEDGDGSTEEAEATDDGPRVKRKKKPAAAKKADDSLEHLDDTSLPEGTEEYVLPGVDLLTESDDINFEDQAVEVRRKAKILEKTFADFGFNVRVVEIETGPVIAQYEVELEAGLRLSKITSLADDLAIALRVPSVRIVAPIPGKNTVGIEVPNETRQVVRLREVIEEGTAASKKAKIPLFLGKDVSGNPLTVDWLHCHTY